MELFYNLILLLSVLFFVVPLLPKRRGFQYGITSWVLFIGALVVFVVYESYQPLAEKGAAYAVGLFIFMGYIAFFLFLLTIRYLILYLVKRYKNRNMADIQNDKGSGVAAGSLNVKSIRSISDEL